MFNLLCLNIVYTKFLEYLAMNPGKTNNAGSSLTKTAKCQPCSVCFSICRMLFCKVSVKHLVSTQREPLVVHWTTSRRTYYESNYLNWLTPQRRQLRDLPEEDVMDQWQQQAKVFQNLTRCTDLELLVPPERMNKIRQRTKQKRDIGAKATVAMENQRCKQRLHCSFKGHDESGIGQYWRLQSNIERF
jgi:hypothetical protein